MGNTCAILSTFMQEYTYGSQYWSIGAFAPKHEKRTMTTSRRTFVIQSLTGAGALACAALPNAAFAQVALTDADPQAVALGYKTDATKADAKKYPKYAAGQHCANCALYQGKATDAEGGCPLFAGKKVAGKGWCSAWAKKA